MSNDRVGIGAAAALFGLAPSTLRWWEQQAVLPPVARDGARRSYDDRELRRIGLAYLCCVAGTMPLDRAAVVVSGQAGNAVWRAAVAEQVGRIAGEITRLEAAREQLRHLLECPDDDPAAACPYLDALLVGHTPRGRVDEPDLLTAARAAGEGPPVPRDGSRRIRHDDGARRCLHCAAGLPPSGAGRPRRYCSPACRQRAYRRRTGSGA